MACSVVDQHCTHPANLDGVTDPRTKCVWCEEPTCSNCSYVMRNAPAPYPHGRYCPTCLDDLRDVPAMWEALARYVRRWYRLSGYIITLDSARRKRNAWYSRGPLPPTPFEAFWQAVVIDHELPGELVTRQDVAALKRVLQRHFPQRLKINA